MLSDDADDGEDDPYVPYPPKDRKRNRGAPPPAGGAGALLMEIHDVNDPIDALAFSPDGRFLAAGSRENYIDIYEVRRDPHCHRCPCCGSLVAESAALGVVPGGPAIQAGRAVSRPLELYHPPGLEY